MVKSENIGEIALLLFENLPPNRDFNVDNFQLLDLMIFLLTSLHGVVC